MPQRSLHHVSLLTFDAPAVIEALTTMLALPIQSTFTAPGPELAQIMDIPDHGDVECWILGEGNAGLIEVCALPESLRGIVEPGLRFCAFTVRDVAPALAAGAAIEGAETKDAVDVPALGLRSAVVRVGGLAVELVSYG